MKGPVIVAIAVLASATLLGNAEAQRPTGAPPLTGEITFAELLRGRHDNCVANCIERRNSYLEGSSALRLPPQEEQPFEDDCITSVETPFADCRKACRDECKTSCWNAEKWCAGKQSSLACNFQCARHCP